MLTFAAIVDVIDLRASQNNADCGSPLSILPFAVEGRSGFARTESTTTDLDADSADQRPGSVDDCGTTTAEPILLFRDRADLLHG